MLEIVAWYDPDERTLVFWRMKFLRQFRLFFSLTDLSPGVLASIWASPMYSFLHWGFEFWQFITSFKALHKSSLLLRFSTASSNFSVKHLFNFLNSELPQVPMTSLSNWPWFLMKLLMHSESLWGKEFRCCKKTMENFLTCVQVYQSKQPITKCCKMRLFWKFSNTVCLPQLLLLLCTYTWHGKKRSLWVFFACWFFFTFQQIFHTSTYSFVITTFKCRIDCCCRIFLTSRKLSSVKVITKGLSFHLID